MAKPARCTLQIMWFILYVVSTLYTFAWDVLQDWGLGHGEFHYLRKKRLFSSPWVGPLRMAQEIKTSLKKNKKR